jgi:hypothetical protein
MIDAAQIASALGGARPKGNGWLCLCPCHPDKTPSLSLDDGGQGKILVKCFAGCDSETRVIPELKQRHLWPGYELGYWHERKITSTHEYTDEEGVVSFEIVRLAPDPANPKAPKATCRHRERGGWVGNAKGCKRYLYKLPNVLKAKVVYLCEGEKDADALVKLGLTATTNPFGAAAGWLPEYTDSLKGKTVYLLPDNDGPGQEHMCTVAYLLKKAAISCKVIELPGLPEKGDVRDWLAAGGTKDKLRALVKAAPWYKLQREFEPKAKAKAKAKEPAAATVSDNDEWPKPKPITGLPPVAEVSEDMFPEAFLPLCLDIVKRMQVPLDYAYVGMIGCLAGAVNRRALVQPKARDTEWTVVPNAYCAIVGPSGTMKTPVLEALTAPLRVLDGEWRKAHAKKQAEYEKELAEWKESKQGKAPQKLIERCLLINDSTYQAVQATMLDNPLGLFMLRDELSGWLSSLDEDHKGSERGFYLTAWGGQSGYSVKTISRGDLYLPHCCLSIMGTLTPQRLKTYLLEGKTANLNDGFLQRFSAATYPNEPGVMGYVDEPPHVKAIETAAKVMRTLAELSRDEPILFKFDDDAQLVFQEWYERLMERMHSLPDGELRSHLSKYRKLMPSLAVNFQLTDLATAHPSNWRRKMPRSGGFGFIDRKHTERAVRASEDYFESHARRIYSLVRSNALDGLNALAEKIKEGRIPRDKPFAAANIYQKGWRSLNTPQAVHLAAQGLVELDWLRAIEPEARFGPGRVPNTRWLINPRCPTQEKGEKGEKG